MTSSAAVCIGLLIALVCGLSSRSQTGSSASVHPANSPEPAFATMVEGVNDRYASVYAESAPIVTYGSGEIRGRPAIEQHDIELFREFPVARLGLYEVWRIGRQAVVHYGVNGRTSVGKAVDARASCSIDLTLKGESQRSIDMWTASPRWRKWACPARHPRAPYRFCRL